MTDVPEFKKCCFYIPLRHGVIFWGYFNVLVSLVMLGLGISPLVINVNYYRYASMNNYPTGGIASLVITFIALSLVAMLHLGFSIVLIVAAHKTNTRLLNIFYKYGKYRIMVYATVMVIVNLLVWFTPYNVTNYIRSCLDDSWAYLLVYNPALGIIDMLLQCYFVLLLRSYLLTFENNAQFKPLENEPEPECTLEIDRNGESEKIIIKNIKIKMRH